MLHLPGLLNFLLLIMPLFQETEKKKKVDRICNEPPCTHPPAWTVISIRAISILICLRHPPTELVGYGILKQM